MEIYFYNFLLAGQIMEISGVNNYQSSQVLTNDKAKEAENAIEQGAVQNQNTTQSQTNEQNEAVQNDVAAVYEKSDSKDTVYKPDLKKIQDMLKESDAKTNQMKNLVEKLLLKQSSTADKAQNQITNIELSKETFENLVVDEETQKQAQEDISEDGYYGVKQTSERLLDFAKALSGGDPSKIGLLRDAVEKGFAEAEKAWGDKLPEISQKTHEAVMKGFDEWEKQANTSVNATEN